jgi:Flp pilus assembly protein TadG
MKAFRTDQRERGAMLIQMAVAAIAFAALAALAFDWGVKLIARTQAQASADAGALAGAISLVRDDASAQPGLAKTVARAVAHENSVWLEIPAAEALVMPDDPNTTGADCTASSPCVRVNVYRNQLNSGVTDPEVGAPQSLETFFARFVGVMEQGVRATATAQVKKGNSATCMMPFGVADRWADFADSNIDESVFTNDGDGVGSSDLGEGISGWSPNDNYDLGTDIYRSPITYPNPNEHTGWTVERDYGRQLILKFGGTGTYSSGWANRIDLYGSTGGNEYKEDIETCNPYPISIASATETCAGYPNSTTSEQGAIRGCVSASTGVTQGPTEQGIGTVVGEDLQAAWNPSADGPLPGMTGAVTGGAGMATSRIRPLVVFDINHYMSQGCSGSTCTVKVANILGFFIEGMCPNVTMDAGNACSPPPDGNREVVGRIVTLPSQYISGLGEISEDASFLKTIVLVR